MTDVGIIARGMLSARAFFCVARRSSANSPFCRCDCQRAFFGDNRRGFWHEQRIMGDLAAALDVRMQRSLATEFHRLFAGIRGGCSAPRLLFRFLFQQAGEALIHPKKPVKHKPLDMRLFFEARGSVH